MKYYYLAICVCILGFIYPDKGMTAPPVNQCLNCHLENGFKEAVLFKKDIHYQVGLTCAGCHGGNPNTDDMDKAMSKSAGFIGKPKGDVITKICSSCHSSPEFMKKYDSKLPTNQASLLKTSVHGRLSISGKEKLVQCSTCHNAHGIVPPSDLNSPVNPRNVINTCGSCHSNANFMKVYKPSIPIDQVEKYRTSIHGILHAKGDLKVAVCFSCHGSHGILSPSDVRSMVYKTNLPSTCAHCHSNSSYMKNYKIPTDQFKNYSMSVHGNALLVKHDLSAPACNDCHGNHGATPPGVESISQVCGTCHALNAELFSTSPHKKAFDSLNYPECETCHSNHLIITATDKLIGVDNKAVCSRCHSQTNNPKGYIAAKTMKMLIDSLENYEKNDNKLINEAEQKGMEVGDAKYKLRDVQQSRLEARTAVHAFNLKKFEVVVNKGLAVASDIHSEAMNAINDYFFRRYGLGIATLIITILAISLYRFIRRIERKNKNNV